MSDARLEAAVKAFFDRLEREYEDCQRFLAPADSALLRRAYGRLVSYRHQPERRLGAIDAWCNRMRPLVGALAQSPPGTSVRVLDAGCGFGSEAILFAHLGAEVTGVDLREERLRIAPKRAAYYRTLAFCDRPPEFRNRNIFTHLEENPDRYDAIWSQASIEHIEPAQTFLDLSGRALKPHGAIVISSVNKLNPLISARIARERGATLYTQRADPETGAPVPYAIERLYSTFRLRRMLAAAGFASQEVHYHSFTPVALRGRIGYASYAGFDAVARRLPLFRHLGGSYTVVGWKRKPCS